MIVELLSLMLANAAFDPIVQSSEPMTPDLRELNDAWIECGLPRYANVDVILIRTAVPYQSDRFAQRPVARVGEGSAWHYVTNGGLEGEVPASILHGVRKSDHTLIETSVLERSPSRFPFHPLFEIECASAFLQIGRRELAQRQLDRCRSALREGDNGIILGPHRIRDGVRYIGWNYWCNKLRTARTPDEQRSLLQKCVTCADNSLLNRRASSQLIEDWKRRLGAAKSDGRVGRAESLLNALAGMSVGRDGQFSADGRPLIPPAPWADIPQYDELLKITREDPAEIVPFLNDTIPTTFVVQLYHRDSLFLRRGDIAIEVLEKAAGLSFGRRLAIAEGRVSKVDLNEVGDWQRRRGLLATRMQANLDKIHVEVSFQIEKQRKDFEQLVLNGDSAKVKEEVEGSPWIANNPLNPLLTAIDGRRGDIVHLLLDAGADPNRLIGQDVSLHNSLSRAISRLFQASDARARREYLAISKDLLRYGALPNAACYGTAGGTSMLESAVLAGDIEVAQMLLEAGADANRGWGIAPIHAASVRGDVKMVELLCDSGADVQLKSSQLATPYYLAQLMGHEAIAEMLVARGVEHSAVSFALLDDVDSLKRVPNIFDLKDVVTGLPIGVLAAGFGRQQAARFLARRWPFGELEIKKVVGVGREARIQFKAETVRIHGEMLLRPDVIKSTVFPDS